MLLRLFLGLGHGLVWKCGDGVVGGDGEESQTGTGIGGGCVSLWIFLCLCLRGGGALCEGTASGIVVCRTGRDSSFVLYCMVLVG